ncbi:MAG: hypothetical protein OHK0015_35940 [Chloroflexi bacterium OHK40]
MWRCRNVCGCAADGAGRRLLAEPTRLSHARPGNGDAFYPADASASGLCVADRCALADSTPNHYALPALPGSSWRGARALADAGAGAAALSNDG